MISIVDHEGSFTNDWMPRNAYVKYFWFYINGVKLSVEGSEKTLSC